MEVANAPPRRPPTTTAQPASQQPPPAARGAAEYQLTELKNVPTRAARTVANDFDGGEKGFPTIESSIDEDLSLGATATESRSRDATNEDFQLRLINAVRENPCLYDPLNEFYRDKPENTKFRLEVWDRIAEELNWQSDLSLLIDEWDRIRDLYIQKKTERTEDTAADRLCQSDILTESMQWIDEYIFEDAPLSAQSHMPLSPTNTQDVYFNDVNHDVMISGYQQPSQSSTNQRTTQSEPHSGGFILLRQASPTGGQPAIRLVGNSSGGGNAATRSTAAAGVPKTASATSSALVRPQRVHVVHAPTSSSSQFVQKVPQEGITVTASGSAGMVGNVKKDTVTMVVDPSTYYTNGQQKMYRLVNVSELDSSVHPPARKRIAIVQKQTGTPAQHTAVASEGPSLGLASSSNPVAGSRGQLGDDIIIDDGIEERTVVIEQHDSDSPLLGDSPLSTMMVSGHQAVPRGTSQSRHMQLSMNDQMRPQGRIVTASPQHHSPSIGPGYLQSQYDADLQFQQFISQNLSVLNDDEKAIAKMHIQKILMDARFGQGTCLRIMQEEEMAAQAEAAGPSGSRDGTQPLDM